MKTIRRTLTAGLIAGAFMLTPRAEAQMIQIGAHVTPSLPVGDFSDSAGMDFGFGGKVFGNYYFDDLEQLSVGLEIGFTTYTPSIEFISTDNNNNPTTEELEFDNQSLITIMATPTWHFLEADDDFDIYAGLGIGVALGSGPDQQQLIVGGDTLDLDGDELNSAFFNDTYLAFSPRFGVSLDLDDGWRLDGNVEFLWANTPSISTTFEQFKLDANGFPIVDPNTGLPEMEEVTVENDPPNITAINLNIGITYFIED